MQPFRLKVTAQTADYELPKIKQAAQQQDLTVEVRIYQKERTISQNSLYWMWLGEIAEKIQTEKGYFKADVWHEYFKKYKCPKKTKEMPAGKSIVTQSTKELDVGEMQFYMNQIYGWAINHGVFLSLPSNSQYVKMESKQND